MDLHLSHTYNKFIPLLTSQNSLYVRSLYIVQNAFFALGNARPIKPPQPLSMRLPKSATTLPHTVVLQHTVASKI